VGTSCDLNGSQGPPITIDVNLNGVHERTQRVMWPVVKAESVRGDEA
jgi:hypothetical protein